MRYDKNKIMGAIFPILPKHIPDLFGGDRDVFVKFTKLALKEGMTILFYACGLKKIVGEGKIVSNEKTSPERAWSIYKKRIFLNKKEYDAYVKDSPITRKARKMREINVFVLSDIRKYEKPVSPIYSMTPSGRYIYKEIATKIRERVRFNNTHAPANHVALG